jgi:hypothetical protein
LKDLAVAGLFDFMPLSMLGFYELFKGDFIIFFSADYFFFLRTKGSSKSSSSGILLMFSTMIGLNLPIPSFRP